MSRTITAMYDSRSEAETAKDQLRSALSIDARIVDQSSMGGSSGSSSTFGDGSASGSSTLGGSDDGYNRAASSYDSSGTGSSSYGSSSSSSSYDSSSSSSAGSSGSGGGFWSGLKDVFMSDDDRHTYEEGVRRGGFLLTANVPEEQADEAISILEQGGSVDFDQREQEWRSQGWAGYQGRQATGSGVGATGSGIGATGAARASTGFTGERDRSQEQHIPIVEEQLRVGKREVNRGGARVRSYVEEVPVHETVSLREEHVNIERRPVDQSLSAADMDKSALFQDRTIEVTETAEEAVVAKEARVKEEVVVSKTATEHTEEINDTVRHTNVDIDRGTDGNRGTDVNRSADSDRGGFFDDRNR